MDTPTIEQWAIEEYRDRVSPGAAVRQLIRSLGVAGHYPTLKRLLEEVLADGNRQGHEIARLRAGLYDGLEYFLFQQNFHPDDRETVALDYWTSGHWPEDTRKANSLAAALRERAKLQPVT